jgi:hypothetical protein
MSACPESAPVYWWHIRAGRLRVVSDTSRMRKYSA